MLDGSTGPTPQSGPLTNPSQTLAVKIPKEKRSGAMPKINAVQKRFLFFCPNRTPP